MKNGPFAYRVARHGAFVALLLGSCAGAAFAATTVVTYDSFVETKTIGAALPPGSTLVVDGRLRDAAANSIDNRLFFVPASTSLSLSAAWLLAPLGNRTVGVNIDLYDFNHTLIGTDLLQSSNGVLATSALTMSNLIAGASYELVFTGIAAQSGRYSIAIASGMAAPVINDLPVAFPAANQALFDTHLGDKSLGRLLVDGDDLFIDGAMPDDTGAAIKNDIRFISTAGRLSAGIEWIARPGDPQRTVAFNIDLLDANNVLVASDSFQGLFDGEAFSQLLAPGLAPGAYTLRITGLADLGGRYRIHLTTDATAPGFEPIGSVTAVPEPASWALLALGLGMVAAARRCVSLPGRSPRASC